MGAKRGANFEHMLALLTDILQRLCDWQEDRRTDLQPGFYRFNTASMASLDVKTAFDVVKSSVVSKILHDVQGCFERCIRQGGVEAPVLWGQIRAVESRRKVEGQRLEVTLGRTTRQ